MKHLEMGREARDTITGFVGIIVGRIRYITGCDQLLICPKVKGDNEFQEGKWFDEPRLEYTKNENKVIFGGEEPDDDDEAPQTRVAGIRAVGADNTPKPRNY